MQSAEDSSPSVSGKDTRITRPALGTRALSVRVYLVGRLLISAAIAIVYSLDLGFQYPFNDPTLFFGGATLFSIVGLSQLLAVMRAGKYLRRALWLALPFDLAAIGLLIYGSHGAEDPVYPVVVGLVLFYTLMMRNRDVWIVAGFCSVVYASAHAISTSISVGDYLFLVFKTVAIVVIGLGAAYSIARQAKRESVLRENRERIAGLNDELQKRIAELHAIAEITEIIHSSLEFDQVGPLVMDVLLRAVDLPSCSLFVIDKTKTETLFSASKGLERPQRTVSLANGYDLERVLSNGDEHFECTTLVDHNQMLVVFCAEAGALNTMSEDDRIVLQAVAAELAVAIENSELYKLTKRLAITDDLTDLANYRFLQQRLDEECERARRYGKDLSLLMIDADDFKMLNDAHGHLVGDRVLREIGRVLRSVVREVDLVARYGGEEFSVVLPETDAAGAFVVAEKLREAVAAQLFADEHGQHTVRMTISIGLATFPVHAIDKESLLREADEAVYQAKRTGRDRVRAPRVNDVVQTELGGEAS